MIKKFVYFFVLMLVSFSVFAGIDMIFPVEKVKQGSLQEVTLQLDEVTAQRIELQKLKGLTLGDVVYLYSVSPLLRREGKFQADAMIIFAKVPETNTIVHKYASGDILLTWNNIEVVPTDAPKELLLLDFEIPAPVRVLLWMLIVAGLGILVLIGLSFRKKWLRKKTLKVQRLKLKEEILSTDNYESIVLMWQRKLNLIKEFPHLEDPFKELEKTLFKYQFKPKQTESEKNEVVKAWKDFLDQVRGGFNGI